MGNVELFDWYRDDLPDLIWPAFLVGSGGVDGALAFGAFQQSVIADIGREFWDEHPGAFDGQLTSLEEIPGAKRDQIVEAATRADTDGAILATGHSVLSLYNDPPGWWLFAQHGPVETDEDVLAETQSALARSMASVVSDPHLNALTKACVLTWRFGVGRISISSDMADDLKVWPSDPDRRSRTDSSIRATYAAMRNLDDPGAREASVQWAQRFWSTNWQTSICLSEDDLVDENGPDLRSTDDAPAASEIPSEPDGGDFNNFAQQRQAAVTSWMERFYMSAASSSRGIDLYSPARDEVALGMASRGTRVVVAFLQSPALWNGEHMGSALSSLVEMQIQLAWMSQRADLDVFAKFQDYGRGKRKLYRSVLSERIDSLDSEGVDIPEPMRAAERHMADAAGGRWQEEFQEVGVHPTFFERKSLRTMADESGLGALYREVFQMSRGSLHGEWWAAEDYAMERCMNPLHRWHWLPLNPHVAFSEQAATRLVEHQLLGLLAIAEDVLAVEERAFGQFDNRDATE